MVRAAATIAKDGLRRPRLSGPCSTATRRRDRRCSTSTCTSWVADDGVDLGKAEPDSSGLVRSGFWPAIPAKPFRAAARSPPRDSPSQNTPRTSGAGRAATRARARAPCCCISVKPVGISIQTRRSVERQIDRRDFAPLAVHPRGVDDRRFRHFVRAARKPGGCSSRRITCGSVIFQLSTSRSVGVPRCNALVDSP